MSIDSKLGDIGMNADELSAREEIRDLLARYTYQGDRGRLPALAACFAEDGTLEFPGNKGTGPSGVLKVLMAGVANPAITFVRHHVTIPLIEVADNTATVRSYFTVISNHGPDHSGTYSDRLIKTADGWRFAHRLVRIDWQSESSLFRPMVSR
jgi:SnoaL-like domain